MKAWMLFLLLPLCHGCHYNRVVIYTRVSYLIPISFENEIVLEKKGE